ncbi:MAG TPA: carbohydrate kinase, partial [Mesoaciditoga lauensis]|nr:carbohydrate kinase [Mesoaciditoga lauensis]
MIDLFKIDDSFEPHVGGSPLNIAVGLSRLGENVSYITRF